MLRRFFVGGLFSAALFLCVGAHGAFAATCSITADTVIDQTYVDDNSCTSIDINADVSTTWIGTTNLSGGTVTVKSGFTMTMGSSSQMVLGAADDLVVESGAVITHTPEDPMGLQITARDVTVAGSLDASAKGCAGSGGAEDGSGPNTSTGVCGQGVSGAGRGAGGSGGGGGGGSHAGLGGDGSAPGGNVRFGSSVDPSFLGSGGGGGYYYGSAPGGAGGGRISLTVSGTLTVTGSIRADGGTPPPYVGGWNGGGGGAGGSVRISANVVTGGGVISANGGNGASGGGNTAGGGGGGRIALFYNSFGVFSLSQLSFAKGLKAGGGADGGEGTIYTLNRVTDDGDGDLYVGGSFFDIPAGADFARNSVTISPGTTLTCPYDMTTLTVSSTQWLTLDGVTVDCAANITNATIASNVGISTTSTSITFSHTTSVSFIAPAWSNVSTTIVVTKPGSTTLLDVPTDLTVRDFTYTGSSAGTTLADGGRLFIPDMMTFTMVSSTITANVSSTFATLSIDAHSTLQATGTGCPGSGGAENGYGPNGEGVCGQSLAGAGFGAGGSGAGGGGASYGGLGGAGTGSGLGGSTLYGSSLLPDSLGSGGGGGYYYGTGPGGAGGGRMVLRVLGTFVLDGAVRADGATAPPPGAGYSGGGGGSGGSVLVVAGTMTGTGAISANGGNGSHGGGNESGGGGGGRIALFYGALGTFAPTHLSAVKGVTGGAATDGEPGTAYALDRLVDDGAGTMSIVSGFDFPAGGDYARDAIVFGSGTHLSCSAGTDLTVSSTARLAFDGVTWTCSSSLTNLTIASDVGLSTTSTTFDFSGVSHVSVIAPDWTNVTTTMSVTNAGASTTWDVVAPLAFQDFTYMGARAGRGVDMLGGDLYIPHENSIAMVSSTIWSNVSSTLASLSIDALSSWTALGRGCEAGTNYDQNGYGPDLVTGGCTQSVAGFGNPARGCCGGAGGGAAYGGAGGGGSFSGPQTTTYGSETNPDYFGSGGGGGWGVPGGVGGGRIRLTITGSLLLDGSVRADGADAPLPGTFYGGGGGGSGGTVNLYAATISGSGLVTANGGSGYPTQSTGGGGGGRVLYTASLFTFGGTSSTTGGFGGLESGSEGTVHLTLLNQPPSINPASLGQAVLVNGSTTGTNNPVFTFDISDPDGADTEQYRIQIDNDSDFSSPVVDYTSALGAQGTRTFQVGQAIGGGTYTVGSSGQTLVDGAYYWQVQAIDVASAASAYATANGGAMAFQVDTTIHSIQFAQSTASALESVTATSVRITLNTPHFETVTVHYAVTGGTATGGAEDYTLASGTATIAAGDTSATIPLVIVDDSVAEPSETLVITLSSPTFASLGARTTHTYTILDNDTAGVTVSASSLSLTEGQSSDYTIVFTSAPTTTVTITPTVSGLATVSPASLSFSSLNWSTPQTVTVTATDDSVYQGTHSATVSHDISTTAYGYDAITLGTVSVSITDNDSSGGGASTAGSGSAGSIAMPVTWSFTSPVIPPTAPVSSGPTSSPSPSTESPVVPTAPSVPTPTPTPDAPVTFRAPPASVRVGDTLRFTYSYANPSTRPQTVTIVRELVDSRGRVARTSRTTSTLRPGASFSRTVSERVTSRAGSYTERVRVLDGRGRSLSSSSFPVGVTVPVRGR